MILLKHFKKVAEDKHTATLTHKDGHKITIAKKGLKGPMRKQLDELPLAEGGMVSEGATASSPASRLDAGFGKVIVKANQKEQYMADGGNVMSQAPNDAEQILDQGPNMSMPQAPGMDPVANAEQAYAQKAGQGYFQDPAMGQDPSMTAPGQMQPNSSDGPAAPAAPTNLDMGGQQAPATPAAPNTDFYQKTGNAIMAGGKAEQQQNNAQGQVMQDSIARDQQFMSDVQQHHQAYDSEVQNIIQDMKDQHIDANHYLSSMSAPGKVSTAIGLILGGIGGGLTGQENPAAKFLSQQIDRDIEGQKMEMGKKNNIMKALTEQLGSQDAATTMTHAIYNTQVVHQLQAAASKYANPVIQARAMQAAAPFMQAAEQAKQKLAVMGALKGQAGTPSYDPSAAVQYMVPKEHQAKALEEVGKYNGMKQAWGNIRAKQEELHNQFMNGTFSPSARQSAIMTFVPVLEKQFEGRYNHEAVQAMAESYFPNRTDFSDSTYQKKANNVDSLFAQEIKGMTPTLNGYGIPTPGLPGRTKPIGRK